MMCAQVGEVHVIKLSGTLGYEASEKLKESLVALLEKKTKKIIIDMSEIEMITSGTLGIFYTANKDFEVVGGALILVGLQPHVLSSIHEWRLERFLHIYDTMEEARNSLNRK